MRAPIAAPEVLLQAGLGLTGAVQPITPRAAPDILLHAALQSAWAGNVGAFINLEATGSSGPDLLFQHAGSWTTKEYARVAPIPHGSVFLQVGPCRGDGGCRLHCSQLWS